MKTLLYLFFLFTPLMFNKTFAQDSLYLVGTITGETNEKRIYDVKGIGDVNGDGFEDFITTHYFDRSASLYFGSAKLDLTPDLIFRYPNSEDSVRNFGIPSGIGDVTTKINYSIPEDAKIQIKIYDILGVEVVELVNESKPAGYYEADFNASGLSSGVYIYKPTALSGDKILFSQSKQMILVK